MKRVYFKRILEFSGFFFLFFVLLIISSKIFIPKWLSIENNYNQYMTDSFYKERKDSLDLIFIGNSDMYHAILPMELWNSYGIASYNYSKPGTRVWIDYYNLKNILLTQRPKYIVLSVDSVFTIGQSGNGDTMKSIIPMKFSKNKIESILNNDVQKSYKIKASYFFPIIRFHSRYNDLTSEDFIYAFKTTYMPTKGAVISENIKPLKKTNYMNRKHKVENIPPKSKEYLDKIVSTCKKNNIELLLLETPSADSWNYKRHDIIDEYSKNNNLKFIDLNLYTKEIKIDWNHDTKDAGNHLNFLGAIKVTKYLGKYLNDNLDLPDRRKDEKYSNWNDEYKQYLKLKEDAIEKLQKEINK